MLGLSIFFLLWLALSVALLAAWLRAEIREKPRTLRLELGIAASVCLTTFVGATAWSYEAGREEFDFRNFRDTLGAFQDALHEGKSHQIEQLLQELPSELDAASVSELQAKLFSPAQSKHTLSPSASDTSIPVVPTPN